MVPENLLLNEFITESKEHLRSIEGDFIQLEKQQDNPDKELVNRIMRAAHTIKGTAGFFGLKNITEVAHVMETLLTMIRDSGFKPGPGYVDALFQGVDCLNSLLDDVEGSNSKDTSQIRQLLQNFIEQNTSKAALEQMAIPVKVAVPEGASGGFDIRQFDLKSVAKEHRHLYILSFDLNQVEKEQGKSPVMLIKELMTTGTIIDGFISNQPADLHKGLPDPILTYHVLYATVLDTDIIEFAVGLPSSKIVKVDKQKLLSSEPGNQPETPSESLSKESQIKTDPALTIQKPSEEKAETQNSAASETIRIRLDILDRLMMLAGELVLVRNQQLMHVDPADAGSRTIAQRLNVVTSDLQETIMRTRMQPMGSIFGKFTRIVRDLGKKLGKKIEIEVTGNEVELDKSILEALTDPLTHLIRNCCDHGIESPEVRREMGKPETGLVLLKAYHEGGQMNVEISDDGKGIDAERIKKKAVEKGLRTTEQIAALSSKEAVNLIFLPGLSTAEKLSDVSGRGVGMDVVKAGIEKLGGVVEIQSTLGLGTKISLRLPLTLAIIPSLIIQVNNQRYAIPQINLEEVVCLYDDDVYNQIEYAASRELYRLRDLLLPMVHLTEVLNRTEPFSPPVKAAITENARAFREKQFHEFQKAKEQNLPTSLSQTFAVLKVGNMRYGLIIDGVIGTEEIVVKPMHRALKDLSIYSGATVLGDGSVALILDPLGISRHADIHYEDREEKGKEKSATDDADRLSLLLFKSGANEQFGIITSEIKRIEKIKKDQIEKTGNKEFITIDGESTLILRLDQHLKVSPITEKREMFLLLPKKVERPYGILMTYLLDIGTYAAKINTDSYKEVGISGTSIIKDHMTLIVNPGDLIRKAVPEWYK